MNYYGNTVSRLIEEFAKFPGVGGKSAQRMAFHVLNMPRDAAVTFADAVLAARQNVKYCSVCCNLTDSDPCVLCGGESRDTATIMVVEDPRDMAAYEKTREFKGTYHVLHGAISPMDGVGPNELKVKELLQRLTESSAAAVTEIIIATNPNIEGEATAMYLSRLIKPLGIKVTRIAHGVPVGGDLEYVDEVTLSRALEGRREM
jgi:recombination protein RecR